MRRRAGSADVLLAILVPAALFGGSLTAHAAGPSRAVAFEREASVRTVGKESDPLGTIRCTYFRDLMIREPHSESPAPGPANLIPIARDGRRPPCSGASPPQAIVLPEPGYGFGGKAGPFLLLAAADPNGAFPFIFVDAATGQTIYRDGTLTGAFKSVSLEGEVLHLRFQRAVNASCSILQDPAKCWATMQRDGLIPQAIAALPPPVQACAAAYRLATVKTLPDDPSIVFYDVDMTLDRSGKAQVLSRGVVQCAPLP